MESYREGSKVRQRVICTLGRLEELQARGQVDGIICSLSKFSDKLKVAAEYEAGNLEAKRVTRIGPDLITGRLWTGTGLAEIVSGLSGRTKHSFSLERAIYLSILSRLFFPGSDRRAMRIARDYLVTGAEGIELHQIYRAMAWLGDNREAIEEELFDRGRDLFTSLSVVFFDTTS
ncbi:MAG: transposase, partial [Deltaproteobacteria bacterium]|nr:transposase [Deltaproteobacteria bacterium]